MAEYKDVMLDLETLGLAPGCVVLSIGAVAFNHENPDRSRSVVHQGPLGPEYHRIIQADSSTAAGLFIDSGTMAWWERQSAEAKKTLLAAQKTRATGVKKLLPACVEFNKWISQFGKVRVWGNGANFDQPILRAAFTAAGVEPCWSPFEERCYRTLKNLVPGGPKLERVGTYHNALDDAISQAHHAVKLLRILHGQGKA